MKLRIGSTTGVGLAALAAGLLGKKIGLDTSAQVQLVLGGLGAVAGRNAVGKVLEALAKLDGGKG